MWQHFITRTKEIVYKYEPRHEKTCLRVFPTRSDSNWPTQLQKLAWGLKIWRQKLEILHYLGSKNKGADQTARMRRLICAFVVRIWHKTRFFIARPICICLYREKHKTLLLQNFRLLSNIPKLRNERTAFRCSTSYISIYIYKMHTHIIYLNIQTYMTQINSLIQYWISQSKSLIDEYRQLY